tara:strand:+ start:954 stop:1202 length:249 start_codon:yes stop_codon:yes gene_type:complete
MDNFLENYTVGMKVGYNILMGKQDLDDIVFYLDEIILPFDPVADIIEIEDVDHMISYFEEQEDYEKCEVLMQLKNHLEIEYV